MSKKIKKLIKQNRRKGKKTQKLSGPRVSPLHEANLQQALALHQAGHLPEAEALYRQILAVEPNNLDALYSLGILAHQLGHSAIASDLISKVINICPDHVDALNRLGIIQYEQGKLDEAAASYRQALNLKPEYSWVHYNLGQVLSNQGKLDEAVSCFRQTLSLKPDYVEAHNNLGNALISLGKPEEAAASFRQAISLQPDYVEARNNLGIALMEQGMIEDAEISYRQALNLEPDNVEVLSNLSKCLVDLGRLEEAADFFHKTLTLKPDHVKAYRMLSLIEKHTEYDSAVKAKEDLFKGKDLPDEDRVHLGFALGKIFADLKKYDKSFGFIVKANKLQRRAYEYCIQNDQDFFSKIKDVFSADFFSSRTGSGDPDETPVFIIGMPRSGTTLLEQILASHPLVFGAGELENLANLIAGFCPGGPHGEFPGCVPSLEPVAMERMGADYIAKIRRHSKEAKYITDKMPQNFMYVGLIKVILPNAKIIHCRRDPMDNCLSIFKNYFQESHKYAYDMTELGQYYRLYRGLMEHWERVLPGFMYSIGYEEMIDDQQNQTAKLLEFCGLPWDDACLSFHKTARKVQTASFAQVRQPLYNDSVKLWKRYEAQIKSLRRALEGREIHIS